MDPAELNVGSRGGRLVGWDFNGAKLTNVKSSVFNVEGTLSFEACQAL